MLSENENMLELSRVVEARAHLEALRNHPVLLYMSQHQNPWLKLIEDDDVVILYEALRSLGPLEHLDLVLNTMGGSVATVRKLLHVLHAMVRHLTVLVPYKASSAGTLLCLGAHDIVMTPLAELGPIDPHLQATQGTQLSRQSSRDVALFRAMARDWFGVKCENQDHALSLLRIFSEKIFPLSLTQFFRSEQFVRQVAHEALQFQLPDASPEQHQKIVEHLLAGYPDHQFPINSTDLLNMGLHIVPPSVEEEHALWALWYESRTYLDASAAAKTFHADRVDGLLLGPRFEACHWVRALPIEHEGSGTTSSLLTSHWERLR